MNSIMRALSDLVSRTGLAERLGQTFAKDRDLYDAFGYRRKPSFDDYLSYYQRGDIGAKIIDAAPKATWRHNPEIRSDNEQFVLEVEALNKRLRLYHYLKRVDEISGIGQFGVLLIGTRGDK